MRCFLAVLVLAVVGSAFAAGPAPDLDAVCKEKFGEEKSSGSKALVDSCRILCRGQNIIELPEPTYLEDGSTCDEAKSCLARKCTLDSDIEACKKALGDTPLDHIHDSLGACRVKCHATDKSKNTEAKRSDGLTCGMFNTGKCQDGQCKY